MSGFKTYNVRLKATDLNGPRLRQVQFQSGARNMKAGDPSILVRLAEEEVTQFKGNSDFEIEEASEAQLEAALTPAQRALRAPTGSNRAERARTARAIKAGSIPEASSTPDVPEL